VSSHCQSISESFIEDNLNENDPADDVMSFCDGASQDDAGEVVRKQCIDVVENQDVGKQTGKLQLCYMYVSLFPFVCCSSSYTMIMTYCNVLLSFGVVIYGLSLPLKVLMLAGLALHS
jgi:hypothetical protein